MMHPPPPPPPQLNIVLDLFLTFLTLTLYWTYKTYLGKEKKEGEREQRFRARHLARTQRERSPPPGSSPSARACPSRSRGGALSLGPG